MPGRRRRSRRTSRASRRVEPRPIAGPDAFRDLREPDHVRSQAATLLLIGTHLRGDAPAAAARAAAAGGRTRAGAPDPLPAADVRALGFPRMRAGAARVRPVELLQALGMRVGPARGAAPAPRDARALSAPLLR